MKYIVMGFILPGVAMMDGSLIEYRKITDNENQINRRSTGGDFLFFVAVSGGTAFSTSTEMAAQHDQGDGGYYIARAR